MGTSFKDTTGRQWDLRIRERMLDRLADAGLDLDKVVESNVMEILFLPRRVFGSAIWILCEEQANKLGIADPKDFFADWDGDVREASNKALLDAVLSFFRNPATVHIRNNLPRIEVEMNLRLTQELDRRLSVSSSGDSPAKSE